jgi:hypothetical protein
MKGLMGQPSSHCSTDAWRMPQMRLSRGKRNRLENDLRCSAGMKGLTFSISQAEKAMEILPGICLEHGATSAINPGAI